MVDLPLTTWLAAAIAFVAVALGTVSRRAAAGVVPGARAGSRWRSASSGRSAAQGDRGRDVGLIRGAGSMDAAWVALDVHAASRTSGTSG